MAGATSQRLPLAVIAVSIVAAIVLAWGYTTWAIGQHSHQACNELRILAITGGARTPYDKAIRDAYQHLYKLRCG